MQKTRRLVDQNSAYFQMLVIMLSLLQLDWFSLKWNQRIVVFTVIDFVPKFKVDFMSTWPNPRPALFTSPYFPGLRKKSPQTRRKQKKMEGQTIYSASLNDHVGRCRE